LVLYVFLWPRGGNCTGGGALAVATRTDVLVGHDGVDRVLTGRTVNHGRADHRHTRESSGTIAVRLLMARSLCAAEPGERQRRAVIGIE